MMTNTIELPWPSHELSPNARVHYRVKAKAAASAKFEGRLFALESKMQIPNDKPLVMEVVFSPPTRRHFDADNLLSSCKAALDGIFAACGADDHQIKKILIDLDDPFPGGKVTITIKELSC